MKHLSKILGQSLLVMLAIFSVSSCNKNSDFDNYITHTKPFGFNWSMSSKQFAEIEAEILKDCKLYNLASKNSTKLIKDINTQNCLNKKFHKTFLLEPQAGFVSKDYTISVITKNNVSPVIYEYSFLHSTRDDEDSVKKRQLQATKFKKALKKRYGAPIATGHFDQEALTGFVKTSDKAP